MNLEVRQEVNTSDWNALVAKSQTPDAIYHTTYWADREREVYDCTHYYFTVEMGGTPTFLLLGTDVKSSKLQGYRSFMGQVRSKLHSSRYFRWLGQPVLLTPNPNFQQGCARIVLDKILRLCKEQGIRTVAASPFPNLLRLSDQWKSTQWATFLVDLRASEGELWDGLKKSARKAVRQATDDGINVHKVAKLDELRSYYDFVSECCLRYGKKPYGFIDYETMWTHFHDNAVFETFVAEKDGTMLSGLSVWGYAGSIIEVGSYQSEESYRKKLYGQDLIKWEIIKWGARQGFHTFDLAGINPNPTTEKERGIRQFKEKFGGIYTPYQNLSWRAS